MYLCDLVTSKYALFLDLTHLVLVSKQNCSPKVLLCELFLCMLYFESLTRHCI